MNKLDNKDLERFTWDAMAPGIEKKIQKKKAAGYMKIVTAVAIPVVFIFSILNMSIDTLKPSETLYSQVGQECELVAAPELPLAITKYQDAQATLNQVEESNDLDVAKDFKGQLESETTQLVRNVNRTIVLDNVTSDLATVPNDEQQLAETKRFDFPSSRRASTPSISIESPSEAYVNVSIGEVRRINQLFSVLEPAPTNYDVSIIHKNPIDTSLLVSIRGTKMIETTFGGNHLFNHPGTSVLGTQVSFGYKVYVYDSQYVGLGFGIERLNFNTIYPNLGGVNAGKTSPNSHSTYNVEFYYGYTLERRRFHISLEGGMHYNFMRFSEGNISAPNNEDVFIDIMGENYFHTSFGLSLMLRARVDYIVTPRTSVLIRSGYRQAINNWYKDDSVEIKPSVGNLEIGLSRRF